MAARTEGDGWRAWRALLEGPLRRLVAGQALGQAADGLAQIAFAQIVLFEVGEGATPERIAGVLAATLLPFSVVGPVAGVLIDRWDRRATLVLVSRARASLMVAGTAVALAGSEPAAYALVLLLLSSSRFVLAAKGAALPRTVPAGDLTTANALSSIAGMSATFVGAVGGSAFVGRAPAAGFAGAAVLYLAAASRFRLLPPVGGGELAVGFAGAFRRAAADAGEGLAAVVRLPGVRRPLVAVWAHRLLLGAGFVTLVLVADHRYRLEAPGYGLALAVTGVSAFAGNWVAPWLAARFDRRTLLPAAFFLPAAAGLAAGSSPDLAVLVAGVGVTAFAFQTLKVLADALVQEAAPDVVRGRVFSVYDMLYNVAFVVAGLVLVPLWSPGREGSLLSWLAVAFATSGLLLARVLRAWPWSPGGEPVRRGQAPRVWRGRAGAAALGAVPALAFPEPSVWVLGLVGLVPLILHVRGAATAREATVRAWAAGVGFFLAMHHWLLPSVGPFVVVVAPALGLLWAPWGRVTWGLLHGPASPGSVAAAVVVVPSAWAAVEYLRSWDRLSGPWGLLGASQWNQPRLLPVASLGGVWLLSWALLAVNTALAAAVASSGSGRARTVAALLAAALAGGMFAHGWVWDPPASAGEIRVGVVQTGQVLRGDPRFDAHLDATRAFAPGTVDLVVWAESSVAFDLEDRPEQLARLAALAGEIGADVLVNVDARRGAGGIYKSTLAVGAGGVGGRYDKQRLVPFGEYVPLRPLLGWVARFTEAADEDRRRGSDLAVLRVGGIRAGPLVCFESSFPDMARELAGRGAELIVLQTATTTFQGSWAQPQHASLAAVRAVESGRPMVHAAVSGVSAAFDAGGRRLLWVGDDATGSFAVNVPLAAGRTPYVRFGDWAPAAALLVLGLAATTQSLRRSRRTGTVTGAPPR